MLCSDLVHQIYSEEVYGMLQRGLASSKRPLRADVSLLPVSHQIFPGALLPLHCTCWRRPTCLLPLTFALAYVLL